MALPHYLNSRPSIKNYEPVYQNIYEVSLLPPASVSGGELLLEHVRSISGLEQDFGSPAVTQEFKEAGRSYASGRPDQTFVDLSMTFSLNLNDNNEMYTYKALRSWYRAAYNPLTGEKGLKKDYVGSIVVTMANRKGDIFWQRTFHECFPTGNVPALDLDYSGGEPLELSGVVFRCDWWEENIV